MLRPPALHSFQSAIRDTRHSSNLSRLPSQDTRPLPLPTQAAHTFPLSRILLLPPVRMSTSRQRVATRVLRKARYLHEVLLPTPYIPPTSLPPCDSQPHYRTRKESGGVPLVLSPQVTERGYCNHSFSSRCCCAVLLFAFIRLFFWLFLLLSAYYHLPSIDRR